MRRPGRKRAERAKAVARLAIGVGRATPGDVAPDAPASAVDVAFGAILDLILASRRRARVVGTADRVDAVGAQRANLAAGTAGANAAAAVDVGLAAVLLAVFTWGRDAGPGLEVAKAAGAIAADRAGGRVAGVRPSCVVGIDGRAALDIAVAVDLGVYVAGARLGCIDDGIRVGVAESVALARIGRAG